MWKVIEHQTKAKKVIDKAPKQVQRKYSYWKQLIEQESPYAIRELKGFKDHALKGTWEGYRSSYLNDQYRVIYEIKEKNIIVIVEQIGPHDY